MSARGRSRDTSPRVDRLQLEQFRRMTPIEKAEIVTALTQATEQLALAGLRQQYSDAADDELKLRLAVRRLGAEIVRKVWGWPETGA